MLLLSASLGFTVNAAHASTYHRLYGSLAGVVVFLVWLWLSNLAFLTGAQFNVVLAPDHFEADPGSSGRRRGGASRLGGSGSQFISSMSGSAGRGTSP
ncbi:YhjD/YihY/BrkB family envelope integrity protein [Streptomyces sp. NPDC003480]